jgi:hypothetical protein
MTISTIRPGILVHLSVTMRGGVQYDVKKIDAEGDAKVKKGEAEKAKWETERTIFNPKEHAEGVVTRSKARGLITAVCVSSGFGLMCPEADAEELQKAIDEARAVADDFNKSSKLTKIKVYALMGRIAQDDLEAVRAINSEVSELLENMNDGIKDGDFDAVREAANKAKGLAEMLAIEAQTQANIAIAAARAAATEGKKAQKNGNAVQVDRRAMRKIAEARTMFLDTDEAQEVAAPKLKGRALDMAEA